MWPESGLNTYMSTDQKRCRQQSTLSTHHSQSAEITSSQMRLLLFAWNHCSPDIPVLSRRGAACGSVGKASDGRPGAILTRVRFSSVSRDCSPRVSFQCKLSDGVRTAPVKLHASTSVCTLKIPNTGRRNIVGTHEIIALIDKGR